ncbi:ATP-binding protein [Sphingobacterium sp. 18053]|uniref:ATP-binding protein n=1 Tax=Sphingobacterium sp. 18053 TaxID=2681401 RepID=UPI0013583C86|nr:ATP-binding protein [Sphingobacterium sp. 18053]
MTTVLRGINDKYDSYHQIIDFYENNKSRYFDEISLTLTGFFSANMSAALGAVLDLLAANINDIGFEWVDPAIESILQRNDFLSYYGWNKLSDTNHTTIKFQKLKPTDGKYFKTYVIEELIGRDELPNMSVQAKEKIVEAIYEMFVNAQIHSETNFIYTCGQFFPNVHKILFTIVDTGVGFRHKVNQRFNSNLSSTQAIQWAIQNEKTTKVDISGGLGLAVLKEFVGMNKGMMQIVSRDGFYQYDTNGETIREFKNEFPGTVVNLQFNTNDKSNYVLKSEIDMDDIL